MDVGKMHKREPVMMTCFNFAFGWMAIVSLLVLTWMFVTHAANLAEKRSLYEDCITFANMERYPHDQYQRAAACWANRTR